MNNEAHSYTEEQLEGIKEITSGALTAAGLIEHAIEIKTNPLDRESLYVSVRSTADVSYLIGRGGGILNDLQTILNAIFKKRGISKFVLIDINDYRRERLQYIKDLAARLATKVVRTKTSETMEPMPFYERKVVHIELGSSPDVVTESEGKGPDRHIVIRPNIF